MLGQMIAALAPTGQAELSTRSMVIALAELRLHAKALGLRSVEQQLDRIRAYATGEGEPLRSELRMLIIGAYDRLRDSLEERILLTVDPSEAELYRQETPPFGVDVDKKFPSAAYDIQEAARCVAMGRSTAAVFHSVRCLEAAVLAISRSLGAPDPIKAADRNWGKMLDKVKTAIESRWPTPTDRLAGDGQIFEELYGSLAGMQNPYRNSTMHLDKVYTEEDARHIFEVVRGLMRRVASRCDQEGELKCP